MARIAAVLVLVMSVLAACGDGDDGSRPATTSITLSAAPSTTDVTPSTAPTTSSPPATTVDAIRGWVQAWYDNSHLESEPPPGVTGPPQVVCDDTGSVDVGALIVCRLVPKTAPDSRLETASLVILALDVDGRSAWTVGTDLPASTADLLELHSRTPRGMTCEDLFSGEATHPFDAATTTPDIGYFWTLAYWALEGRPAAMDPDGDGNPCGAFFEPDVIARLLAGGPASVTSAPRTPATMTPADLAPGDVLVATGAGVDVIRDGVSVGTVWSGATRAIHHLRDDAGILIEPADGASRILRVDATGRATVLDGPLPGSRYLLFGTAWHPMEGEIVGSETALVGEFSDNSDQMQVVIVNVIDGRRETLTHLDPEYGTVTALSFAQGPFVVSHTTPDGDDLLSFLDRQGRPDAYAWPVLAATDGTGHQLRGAHGHFVPTPTWEFLVHTEPAGNEPGATALVVTTFDGNDNSTQRTLEVVIAGADETVTAVDAGPDRIAVSRANTTGDPLPVLLVDVATGATTEAPIAGRASLVPLKACSAWGLERPSPQAELPVEVANTRDEILTAALACDFDRLGELASTGTNDFYATDISDYWTVPPDLFWANAEAFGRDMLARLVHDLSQPPILTEWYGVGPSYRWVDLEACGDYDGLALCRSADITPDGEWLGWLQESP